MVILAVLSVIGGYVGVPHVLGGGNHFHQFLAPVFGEVSQHLEKAHGAGGQEGSLELLLMLVSVAVAFIGIGKAYYFYIKEPSMPKRAAEALPGAYRVLFNKYYVDEIYQFLFVNSTKRLGTILWRQFDENVVDRTVNVVAAIMRVLGSGLRLLQTGFVQDYALGIIIGAVLLILFLM